MILAAQGRSNASFKFDVERFLEFCKEVRELYKNYRSSLEELMKKYDVKVDFDYFSLTRPSPAFRFKNITVLFDDIINEDVETISRRLWRAGGTKWFRKENIAKKEA